MKKKYTIKEFPNNLEWLSKSRKVEKWKADIPFQISIEKSRLFLTTEKTKNKKQLWIVYNGSTKLISNIEGDQTSIPSKDIRDQSNWKIEKDEVVGFFITEQNLIGRNRRSHIVYKRWE
jgi:phosphatidylglycerophosphatase A